MKRQHQKNAAIAAKKAAEAAKAAGTNGESSNGTAGDDAAKGEAKDKEEGAAGTPSSAPTAQGQPAGAVAPTQPNQPRQPWELVDEIMNMLKTAFPLLALTMEKMVDQISVRAKPSSDEDIYRFFAALLADALQVRSLSLPHVDIHADSSNGAAGVVFQMTMASSML